MVITSYRIAWLIDKASTMWEKGSEDAIEGLVDLIHPYFVFGTTVFDDLPYEKLGFFIQP